MTPYIIVEFIYLGSDQLRFDYVNHFIILGWLRLFRIKIMLNTSQYSSLELEARLHIFGPLPFI